MGLFHSKEGKKRSDPTLTFDYSSQQNPSHHPHRHYEPDFPSQSYQDLTNDLPREPRLDRAASPQTIYPRSFHPQFAPPPGPTPSYNEGSSFTKILLKGILCFLGLAICVGVGCFFYGWQSRSYNVPYINAEQNVYKKKPEHLGGYQPPHQDKTVYDQLNPETSTAPDTKEQFLPEELSGQESVAPPQIETTKRFPPGTILVVAPNGELIPVQKGNEALTSLEAFSQRDMPPKSGHPKSMPAVNAPLTRGHVDHYQEDHVDKEQDDFFSGDINNIQTSSQNNLSQKNVNVQPSFFINFGEFKKESDVVKQWSALARRFSLGNIGSVVKNHHVRGKKIYSLVLGPFTERSAAVKLALKLGSKAQVIEK